ncbi:hypothetical protein DB346_22765 [Verrucomicrobia bacterium LW23]|nr:hypothetical protein DB346_22765 [Verrucomicrobia bacterium LW23]
MKMKVPCPAYSFWYMWMLAYIMTGLICITIHPAAHAAPPQLLVLPESPQKLLKFFPPGPSGWELRKSQANNLFSGNLIAIAKREYARPKSSSTNAQAGADRMLRIQLTDTGRAAERIAIFETSEAERDASKSLAGFPAMRVQESGRVTTTILIARRWIVTFELPSDAESEAQPWLISCAKAVEKAAAEVPEKVAPVNGEITYLAETVDELHPARSRSHQATVAGAVDFGDKILPAQTATGRD